MTMPCERSNAVFNAKQFLLDLMSPKKTPRVPLKIRTRAAQILKHFPWDYHINQSSKKLPDIWGKISDVLDKNKKESKNENARKSANINRSNKRIKGLGGSEA